MKKQLLTLVIALAAMAALSAFFGQEKGATLCACLAGLGALVFSFGFKKGFRCECASCDKSIFVPKKLKVEAQASLQASGWRVDESGEYCPTCVKNGVAQLTPQS